MPPPPIENSYATTSWSRLSRSTTWVDLLRMKKRWTSAVEGERGDKESAVRSLAISLLSQMALIWIETIVFFLKRLCMGHDDVTLAASNNNQAFLDLSPLSPAESLPTPRKVRSHRSLSKDSHGIGNHRVSYKDYICPHWTSGDAEPDSAITVHRRSQQHHCRVSVP
ncbi:uncharacterized protein BDV17DRAFT_271151 [Aspergillus undulatus]|uniref:uncharacterized protein n=1 Tax=Aspergillus undulatus TaxID=1810928 RepID=UPI003CCD43F0